MILSRRQQLIAQFLDTVWSAGKVEQCDRMLAERYVIRHDPGDPWDGQTLDLTAFKQRVLLSRAPFPDQRFDAQQWFEDADSVAVTWLWSGTHLGDVANFHASGRRLTMSGATVYWFDEADRICGHWQVSDRLGIFRQLQGV